MDERLSKAILENDVAAFERLVEYDNGMLLQKSAVTHNTALHRASRMGHTALVRSILKLCPELVEEKNVHGETPFHEACRRGHADVVMSLLETEPRVASGLNHSNESPFSLACRMGHLDVVKLLLNQSWLMDIEEDRKGLTGLQELTSGNKTSIVNAMLEARPKFAQISDEVQNASAIVREEHMDVHVDKVERKLENLPQPITNNGNKDENNNKEHVIEVKDSLEANAPDKSQEIQDNKSVRGLSTRKKLERHKHLSEKHRKELTELHRNSRNREYETQREALQNSRNTIILVAILIVTVTFTVGLNPPGGVFQEGPSRGQSTVGRKLAFKIFVITNSIALFTSLCTVIFLVSIIPFQRKKLTWLMKVSHKILWVATSFMATAFVSATWIIVPPVDSTKWMLEAVLAIGGFSLGCVFIYLGVKLVKHRMRKQKWKKKRGNEKKKIIPVNTELLASQHSESVVLKKFGSESSNSDVESARWSGYRSHPV